MLLELAASLLLSSSSMPAVLAPEVPRLRPLSGVARFVVDEALRRSPTIGRLVDELHKHDVLIYLELDAVPGARGSTAMFAASGPVRILRIVIHRRLDPREQIEVLGHELQHAIEIARDDDVVDEASFRELFERIGYATGARTFETIEARKVEFDIRRELMRTGAPSTPTGRPRL
jgi:hypothetical protein